jgi:hypothetical protein
VSNRHKGFPTQCQTTTGVAVQQHSIILDPPELVHTTPGVLGRNSPRIRYNRFSEPGEEMDVKLEHSAAPRAINDRIRGRFAPGYSGNPGGSPEATRRAFNKRFLLDLTADWQQHGREVFKRVRRESPAAYLKVCAMLVPREMKLEHSGGVKAMTDEQIEQAIEAIQTMLAARAGEAAKVIEGTAELAALPAPNRPSPEAALEAKLEPTKRKPNRLMMEADPAIGPRVRKPRKVSPAST